jgi:hypothetical protein
VVVFIESEIARCSHLPTARDSTSDKRRGGLLDLHHCLLHFPDKRNVAVTVRSRTEQLLVVLDLPAEERPHDDGL